MIAPPHALSRQVASSLVVVDAGDALARNALGRLALKLGGCAEPRKVGTGGQGRCATDQGKSSQPRQGAWEWVNTDSVRHRGGLLSPELGRGWISE